MSVWNFPSYYSQNKSLHCKEPNSWQQDIDYAFSQSFDCHALYRATSIGHCFFEFLLCHLAAIVSVNKEKISKSTNTHLSMFSSLDSASGEWDRYSGWRQQQPHCDCLGAVDGGTGLGLSLRQGGRWDEEAACWDGGPHHGPRPPPGVLQGQGQDYFLQCPPLHQRVSQGLQEVCAAQVKFFCWWVIKKWLCE